MTFIQSVMSHNKVQKQEGAINIETNGVKTEWQWAPDSEEIYAYRKDDTTCISMGENGTWMKA